MINELSKHQQIIERMNVIKALEGIHLEIRKLHAYEDDCEDETKLILVAKHDGGYMMKCLVDCKCIYSKQEWYGELPQAIDKINQLIAQELAPIINKQKTLIKELI